MAIEIDCPTCGGTLRVGDEAAGRVVRCGGCMTTVRVPDLPLPPVTDEHESLPHEPGREGEPLPTAPPDDEWPRRRHRRRPPPPQGRGPLFWVLVTLGILAGGAVVLCGGVLLFLPKPAWQTYNRPTAGQEVAARR